MNKIFIKAYLKNNLGDDLFLDILSKKYKNNFYAVCSPKYKYNNRYSNIKFNKSYFLYYLYRIFEKIFNKKYLLEKRKLLKSDYLLNIGGSIFIENKNLNYNDLKDEFDLYRYKPYYILGANFGPYYNNFYKEFIEKNILQKAKDVCFRDLYSYELFKSISNVRVASDIVFSLDTSSIKKSDSNNVVISVIDCTNRFSNQIAVKYENKIIDIIKYFDKLGYQTTLMSFCKYEGDEKAINRIIKKINSNYSNIKVNKYFYTGNIKEALNVIANSSIIFGSRFHANILGLIFDKVIFPIAYSDKTINVLNDLGFNGKILDIRNIDDFSVNDIKSSDLCYKCNIEKNKIDSLKHFEQIDKILERS